MSGPNRWLVVSRKPRPHQTIFMLVDNRHSHGGEQVATFDDWAMAEGIAAVLNAAGPKALDDAIDTIKQAEPF